MSGRRLQAHGDMASCVNDTCPSAELCWRWMKPDHDRQTFYGYQVPDGGNRCDAFIAILPEPAAQDTEEPS